MKTSFWVPVPKLRQLQDLVKTHDLRFCGNPVVIHERALVTVSSEHLKPYAMHDFWMDWQRVTKPINEKRRPPSPGVRLLRWLRRVVS